MYILIFFLIARILCKVADTAAGTGGGASGNPFEGYNVLVDPLFQAGASNESCIVKKPTFSWVTKWGDADKITGYVNTARKATTDTLVPLVVYGIPYRDCSASASGGGVANLDAYKKLIDHIKSKLDSSIRTVIVLEPDVLGNLVSGLCSGQLEMYKDGLAYALSAFNLPNVYVYIDGGNSKWLGDQGKIDKLANLLQQIWSQAGKPRVLRGLSTNVSNYRSWKVEGSQGVAKQAPNTDENSYVAALSATLGGKGLPNQFITDTSRNGKPVYPADGFPCNLAGAGLGVPFTTHTGLAAEDAFIWIKTPGQSDGGSGSKECRYQQAVQNPTEAGAWFQALFNSLVSHAVPSAKECGDETQVVQPAKNAAQKRRRGKRGLPEEVI